MNEQSFSSNKWNFYIHIEVFRRLVFGFIINPKIIQYHDFTFDADQKKKTEKDMNELSHLSGLPRERNFLALLTFLEKVYVFRLDAARGSMKTKKLRANCRARTGSIVLGIPKNT